MRSLPAFLHPSRRAIIAGGLAAGIAPRFAFAQEAPHTFKVGEIEVTVLSDGTMDLPPSFVLPGRELPEIEAAFAAAGSPYAGLRSQVNVVLLRAGKDVILVDTGGGPDFMPTLGKVSDRMQAAGIGPDSITKVVFTHGHPDHLWGVIDALTDDTAFEKAEHVMATAEFEHWMHADVVKRVRPGMEAMAAGSQRRLKSLAQRVKKLKPGDEVVPGVALVDTPGHTPGHVSVMLRSGGQALLIGGDVLTQSVVSFAYPDWRWGPDHDPDLAAQSRRKILDQLATEKIPLLGYHLPWPGVGRVERKDTAYRFVTG